MKVLSKTFIYLIIILVAIAILYSLFNLQRTEVPKVPISEVVTEVRDEKVDKIVVKGTALEIFLKNGQKQKSVKESKDTTILDYGIDPEKVKIEAEDSESSGMIWFGILSGLLPVLLIGFFIWILFRSAQSGSNRALSFGKTTARLFSGGKGRVTFKDVAGLKESKEELMEVVEFLKNPIKFRRLGAKIPKGVLLVGPPGTGKTLLAKAVSGEAGVPFFSISASEFVEMFVGVGASRVRDLFNKAKRNSPSIIFIDELDAIGRQRGAGLGGSHDEREQTLNQILVEMDGFETDTNVIIMSATNRPDVLDPALLRPGRFDRRVVLDLPDIKEREQILKVHVRDKPLAKNVNLEKIARITVGFSGADLENLANEAAILAARRNQNEI